MSQNANVGYEQYLPLSTAKDITRKCWDATSNEDMSDFLGWTLSTLRARGMRVGVVNNSYDPTVNDPVSGGVVFMLLFITQVVLSSLSSLS